MPSLSYGPGFWKNLIGVKASFGCSRNSLLYFLRFSRRILKTYRNRTMGKQIPTFEKAFGILELPEYLNGLECRRLRLMKSDKEKPILIEPCRRLQDLYDEICAARFALITACQSKYPEYISSEDNGGGHLWIQSQFVNTAILWYDAAFDILLQSIWIYFKLYENLKRPLTLNSENFDSILAKCKLENIDKSVIGEQLHNRLLEFSRNYKPTVSFWANTLKHRRMIRYRELSNRKHVHFLTIPCRSGESMLDAVKRGAVSEYDSIKALNIYDMGDVINVLIDYHKDLDGLANCMSDYIEI